MHLGADGASGSGSYVTLDLEDESNILTNGQAAHGVVAQSIGGGGGIAGDTSASTLLTTDYARNNATNAGNATGNGGAVTVTSAATIQVSGKGAIGVVAQSIAGGGGLGGDVSGSFAGSTTTKAGSAVAGEVTSRMMARSRRRASMASGSSLKARAPKITALLSSTSIAPLRVAPARRARVL